LQFDDAVLKSSWLFCGHTVIVSHSTSPDRTTLSAEHFRSLGFFCRRSGGLELATGQSPWPGAQQQQFRRISSLPLSTHSTVKMLH